MAEQAVHGSRALHHRVRRGMRTRDNWVELLRFGIVGGSGYIVNLAVFYVLVHPVDVDYRIASVIAFVISVANNFWWNRHWTFEAHDGHLGFQAARFFAISLGAYAVSFVLLQVLVDGFAFPELGAQAIAIACATPLSFVGNKVWSFVAR